MKRAISPRNLWSRVPASWKRCGAGWLDRVSPAVYLGASYRRCRRFVERAQWWSSDEAAAWQVERIGSLLGRAYARSPFYRAHLGSVGFEPGDFKSLDDLTRLPMIDRATVTNHRAPMCAVSPRSWQVDFVATGGTQGMPLAFYTTRRRSAIEYAYLTASWARAGYTIDMPLAVFRDHVVAPDATGLRHAYDPLLRHHHYSTFHMADEQMSRYVEHLGRLPSHFLHVYPSSAEVLARYLRQTGAPPWAGLKGILAESENIYPDQRRLIEETFGLRLFASYGQTEKVVLAAPCESSDLYHVWPTYGYCELIDAQGQRVTEPGRRGEIVGTGWINDVLPFIRYRTGDFATYVSDRCPACGRAHMLLEDVEGRWPAGHLVARDGSAIAVTGLNLHDDTLMCVRQVQFYQDTPGAVILRVVPAPGFEGRDARRIQARLDERLAGRMTVHVQRVSAIAQSPRGKVRYVDQRIAEAQLAPGRDESPS